MTGSYPQKSSFVNSNRAPPSVMVYQWWSSSSVLFQAIFLGGPIFRHIPSGRIHEKSMEHPWKIMEYRWRSMKTPWKIHGKSMENMENLWKIYGKSLNFPAFQVAHWMPPASLGWAATPPPAPAAAPWPAPSWHRACRWWRPWRDQRGRRWTRASEDLLWPGKMVMDHGDSRWNGWKVGIELTWKHTLIENMI